MPAALLIHDSEDSSQVQDVSVPQIERGMMDCYHLSCPLGPGPTADFCTGQSGSLPKDRESLTRMTLSLTRMTLI